MADRSITDQFMNSIVEGEHDNFDPTFADYFLRPFSTMQGSQEKDILPSSEGNDEKGVLQSVMDAYLNSAKRTLGNLVPSVEDLPGANTFEGAVSEEKEANSAPVGEDFLAGLKGLAESEQASPEQKVVLSDPAKIEQAVTLAAKQTGQFDSGEETPRSFWEKMSDGEYSDIMITFGLQLMAQDNSLPLGDQLGRAGLATMQTIAQGKAATRSGEMAEREMRVKEMGVQVELAKLEELVNRNTNKISSEVLQDVRKAAKDELEAEIESRGAIGEKMTPVEKDLVYNRALLRGMNGQEILTNSGGATSFLTPEDIARLRQNNE